MDERRKQGKPVADFGAFEELLHERIMGVERELLAEELSRGDVDAEGSSGTKTGAVITRQ